MAMEQLRTIILVLIATLISGFGDAHGFIHASNIWQNGRVDWVELGKSAAGFIIGIGSYWVSIKYLKELGINAPELQTLFWFGVTIIGVATVSGKFLKWQAIDQFIAIAVLSGIGWLLFHINE